MADSQSLLNSSRSLAFLISDATDLPPVSRSIHQIAEQSERMLAASATPAVPHAGAATYRFLASQGVDAMDLDPSALELTRPAALGGGAGASSFDAAAMGSAEELDAFLAGEQRQILHEAVFEANQLVVDEFDGAFMTQDREQWEVRTSPPSPPPPPPSPPVLLPRAAAAAAFPAATGTLFPRSSPFPLRFMAACPLAHLPIPKCASPHTPCTSP